MYDSYRYFIQRYTLYNFFNNTLCNWIINNQKESYVSEFLQFSSYKLIKSIKQFYNFSELEIDDIYLFFGSKSTMYHDDIGKDGFIVIISLKSHICIVFEDSHEICVEQGDAIIFYNDIRYEFIEPLNENIIIFVFNGKGQHYNKDWWLEFKRYDKRYLH